MKAANMDMDCGAEGRIFGVYAGAKNCTGGMDATCGCILNTGVPVYDKTNFTYFSVYEGLKEEIDGPRS